jgi:hypothetical protein
MTQTKFQEPFRPVLLNLTVSIIEELDMQANGAGWTRSDVMRRLLKEGLQETKVARGRQELGRKGWSLEVTSMDRAK